MNDHIDMDQHTRNVGAQLRKDVARTRENENVTRSQVDPVFMEQAEPLEVADAVDKAMTRYAIPIKRVALSETLMNMATMGVIQTDEVLNEIANHIEPGSRLIAIETDHVSDQVNFIFEV